MRGPRACTRVAIVIAEHEVACFTAREPLEWCNVLSKCRHRAVDHVSRQNHHVCLQSCRKLDYARDVGFAYRAADVQIADLRDAKAQQVLMQVRESNIDFTHARPSQR